MSSKADRDFNLDYTGYTSTMVRQAKKTPGTVVKVDVVCIQDPSIKLRVNGYVSADGSSFNFENGDAGGEVQVDWNDVIDNEPSPKP